MEVFQTIPVLQVSWGGCSLHLSEHHGDGSPGATVFRRVSGLEAFHEELERKNYAYQRPGAFGNRLRFNEDLK
jgi:hypothetical protein